MADHIEIVIQNTDVVRERMNYAWAAVNKYLASGAMVVTLSRVKKSREQEKKLHAMIRDIHLGAFRGNTFDGVKALMVAEFAAEYQEMGKALTHPGETVYSHKLKQWITVRPSTKKFLKQEYSDFIEYLYAFGCELNIQWSEKAVAVYEEYRVAA